MIICCSPTAVSPEYRLLNGLDLPSASTIGISPAISSSDCDGSLSASGRSTHLDPQDAYEHWLSRRNFDLEAQLNLLVECRCSDIKLSAGLEFLLDPEYNEGTKSSDVCSGGGGSGGDDGIAVYLLLSRGQEMLIVLVLLGLTMLKCNMVTEELLKSTPEFCDVFDSKFVV